MWLHFAVLLLPLATAITPCYFPNGLAESNLNPCNASAEVSACCAPTDICLTNGLCLNVNQSMEANNTDYWRDGCTDANFGPGCPQYCTSTAIDEAAYTGNVLVRYCGESSSPGSSLFCCISEGGSSDCCQNQTAIFQADSVSRYASVASVLSTSTASLSAAAASMRSSTSATATTTPSSAGTSGGLSGGAEAGIVVGAIAAAIIVIGGIVAALWFRRKRRNTPPMAATYTEEEAPSDDMQKPPPSGQYYYTDEQQEPSMAKVELPGEGLQEMPAPWKSNEMPASGNKTTAYELPGSE